MRDDNLLLKRVTRGFLPDEDFRLAARRLVERERLHKADEKASVVHQRRFVLRDMFRELCGWTLLGLEEEPWYRLEKTTATPKGWMGFVPRSENHRNRAVETKTEHLLLAAVLAYFYGLPRPDNHVLLHDLMEGVRSLVSAHAGIEMDWTVYSNRLALQRVLRLLRDELEMLEEYDAGATGGIEGMDETEAKDSVLALKVEYERLYPLPADFGISSGVLKARAANAERSMEAMRSLARKLLLFPAVNVSDMSDEELAFMEGNHSEFGEMMAELFGLRLEYANHTAMLVYTEQTRGAQLLKGTGTTEGKLIFAFGAFLRDKAADGALPLPDCRYEVKIHLEAFRLFFEEFSDTLKGQYTVTIDNRLMDGASAFLSVLEGWNLAACDLALKQVTLSPALGRLNGRFTYVHEGGTEDDE